MQCLAIWEESYDSLYFEVYSIVTLIDFRTCVSYLYVYIAVHFEMYSDVGDECTEPHVCLECSS